MIASVVLNDRGQGKNRHNHEDADEQNENWVHRRKELISEGV